MKKILIVCLFAISVLSALSVSAQDSTKLWTFGGVGAATFSQAGSVNWAAGDQTAISNNLMVSLFAKYKKERVTWDNTLDIGYGMLKQGGLDFRKSDDKIDFNSKFGRGIKGVDSWYISALLSFKTQMAEGFDYAATPSKLISDALAPGYLLLALGMDYKPNDHFTMLLSPITGKMTIVNNQDLANNGAFGVDSALYDNAGVLVTAGKKIRKEFGGFVKIAYNKDIAENVNFQTKLDLFSNYLENPSKVDVNWEVMIGMKINKYMSANINTQLLYDYDVKIADDKGVEKDRIQFKEIFGLGLSYKF